MFKDEPSSKFVNEYEGIETAQLAPPQTFEEGFEKAVEAITKLTHALATAITPIVNVLIPIMKNFADLTRIGLEKFPNRRVVHLALHAKKPRTRKKNQKRILEWLGRGGPWR